MISDVQDSRRNLLAMELPAGLLNQTPIVWDDNLR